jgi:hypothetical protein
MQASCSSAKVATSDSPPCSLRKTTQRPSRWARDVREFEVRAVESVEVRGEVQLVEQAREFADVHGAE